MLKEYEPPHNQTHTHTHSSNTKPEQGNTWVWLTFTSPFLSLLPHLFMNSFVSFCLFTLVQTFLVKASSKTNINSEVESVSDSSELLLTLIHAQDFHVMLYLSSYYCTASKQGLKWVTLRSCLVQQNGEEMCCFRQSKASVSFHAAESDHWTCSILAHQVQSQSLSTGQWKRFLALE